MSESIIDDYVFNVLYSAFNYSATVLVVWEHIITLRSEIAMGWQKRLPPTPVIFLFTIRYSLLVFAILNILPATPTNCVPVSIAQQVFIVLQAAFNSAFSTLRSYALYPQSRIYVIVLIVGLVPIAAMIWLAIYNTASYTYDDVLGSTCEQYFAGSDALFEYIMITTNGSIIFTELLVFAETCHKIWKDGRSARKMLGTKTIYSVMLENGAIYFGGQVLMNVVISLPIQFIPGGFIGDLTMPIVNVLPSILLSRFLFNLREASGGTVDISQHTVVTHLQFCLPTVPQSGISIGAVNLDRFEEDEDDDDICEISDQEDGKKCYLAYRDCGCSQEVDWEEA